MSERLNKYIKTRFKVKTDKWIASDTDSAYFTFDFVSKQYKDKTSKEIVEVINKFSQKIIEPKIAEIYEELKIFVNANENKMIMKQEKISERFLVTGKKGYAALVWDDEGVRFDKPELKVTGIEIVRSSTPNKIKPYLKESIMVLMNNSSGISDYISEVKETFNEMSPEEISFPRSVSEVDKYIDNTKLYKKGTPIAVRAAILYNNYIKNHNIELAEIANGDKIKFFYALTPNEFYNENVFGYVGSIPDREKLIEYVDYSTQFDKVYYDVIKNICDKVGVTIEKVKKIDLDSLF